MDMYIDEKTKISVAEETICGVGVCGLIWSGDNAGRTTALLFNLNTPHNSQCYTSASCQFTIHHMSKFAVKFNT